MDANLFNLPPVGQTVQLLYGLRDSTIQSTSLRYNIIIVRTSMDRQTMENRYLKHNKFFGQIVGVWPEQDKFTKYSIRVFTSSIMILANVTQVSRIVVFFTFDILTDQMPFMVLGITTLLKQYNYIFNEIKLRELLNIMMLDWMKERPKEELEILEMYAKKALLFSAIYKAGICFSMFTFLLLPIIPPFLNIVAPLNESRERVLIYPSYYFVDEQQYFFYMLGHMVVASFVLGFVFIACDINLIHVVQHACALLAVSGYRFKHAMDDADFQNEKYNGVIKDKNYVKVRQSIDAHKRAIEYIEKIEACHVHYIFILTGMIIMQFTVTLVKLTTMEIGTMYLTFCAFAVAQLIHVFFVTVLGQFTIDSNEEVFHRVCEARWYNGSVKTQELYLLVLRKCLSPPKLTGGGLIILNLDSFVQILKASVSYYTVLQRT